MDHAEAAIQLAGAPDRAHDPEAVAARHRWTRTIAQQVLRDLGESGLATRTDGGYRFATDAADAPALPELLNLYHRHPVTLVRAIYAAPVPVKPLIRPVAPDNDSSANG
jgi:hypothetical protein